MFNSRSNRRANKRAGKKKGRGDVLVHGAKPSQKSTIIIQPEEKKLELVENVTVYG